MSMRKAIFMDIDGTLSVNGGAPSDVVVTEIQRARAQGHMFFLCTGRSMGFIPAPLQNVSYIDGVVCGSGTHVRLGEVDIWRERIPRPVLQKVCSYFLKTGRKLDFEGEEEIYSMRWKLDRPPVTHELDFETKYPQACITKLTVAGRIQQGDEAFLGQWFSLCGMSEYFEAILLGNTKATGIEKMLSAIGIPREHSIAVGDSENDLAMLQYAGLGVAMGNASPKVKAQAGYITASYAEDGIAQMIRTCVLGEKV